MIYTVTFNPSLDYIVKMDKFELGRTNRTNSEQLLPGGKGINVSMMLTNFGVENTALGFVAGFTGAKIEEEVKKLGINADFITLNEGNSRINVKLKDINGTEINGRGPDIAPENVMQLSNKLEQIEAGDTLIISGSIPKSLPNTIYSGIMSKVLRKTEDVNFVVDAGGRLLLNVLRFRPFLIKPNIHELESIFDAEISSPEEAIEYAIKLQECGARNVLVSMSAKGAVLVDETGDVHTMPAPRGVLVNSVGSGDSMVAGFLIGYEKTRDYEKAFRMGIAAGSASAFTETMASKEQVLALLARMDEETKNDNE